MKRAIGLMLAVCLFCSVLAGCNGSRSTTDKAIEQLNKKVTDAAQTSKSNYKFSEEFDSGKFHYVVYEGTEHSATDGKDHVAKLSVLLCKGDFSGIKLETDYNSCENYSYAKYNLFYMDTFNISDGVGDYESYLDRIDINNSEIGNFRVCVSGNSTAGPEKYGLINKKYYDDLKYDFS